MRNTQGFPPDPKNWARETATATCILKRFPRTSHPKFVMTCANLAFLLTGKILTTGLVASKRHFVF